MAESCALKQLLPGSTARLRKALRPKRIFGALSSRLFRRVRTQNLLPSHASTKGFRSDLIDSVSASVHLRQLAVLPSIFDHHSLTSPRL
jgi:hypothetical protein